MNEVFSFMFLLPIKSKNYDLNGNDNKICLDILRSNFVMVSRISSTLKSYHTMFNSKYGVQKHCVFGHV